MYLVREPQEKGGRELVLKLSRLRSREASFLGRLKHPRIADFHYQHPATDVDFERLTMPYVGRATFLDIVRLHERDRDVNGGQFLAWHVRAAGSGHDSNNRVSLARKL